jgi:hypothetical protein
MKTRSFIFAGCISMLFSAHIALAQVTTPTGTNPANSTSRADSIQQNIVGDWCKLEIVSLDLQTVSLQKASITRQGDKYFTRMHDKDWNLSPKGKTLIGMCPATAADIQKDVVSGGFGLPMTKEAAVEAERQKAIQYRLTLQTDTDMFGKQILDIIGNKLC